MHCSLFASRPRTWRVLFLAAMFSLGAAPRGALAQGFTNVTASSGISYDQNDFPPQPDYQTYQSGGAAAGDFDGDGWVDLYVTRLHAPAILYRNQGNGSFANGTLAAFGANHSPYQSVGARFGDIDNDGDQDLYVTAMKNERFYLYINNGQGQFTEAAVARDADVAGADSMWGLTGQNTHFGNSIGLGDYDRDGWLDLHTTEWRRNNQDPNGTFGNARLLRNQGPGAPGYFLDRTREAGVVLDLIPSGPFSDQNSFTSHFADFDGDGWQDLAVASDHGTSRMYYNNRDGTFVDFTFGHGTGTDEFGMGASVGDYDADGDLDWFVTSIFDQPGSLRNATGNRLYRNNGDRSFTEVSAIADVCNGGWGWGATFVDFDNDRDLDILHTNGVNYPDLFIPPSTDAGFQNDVSRLFRNNGDGTFTNVAADFGVVDNGTGTGLLTFDYDRDGDQDAFIVNNSGQPVLYRNDINNGNDWLQIDPVGTLSNRDGIGAWITVTPDLDQPAAFLLREMSGGSNFLAHNEMIVPFGLGDLAGATVDQVRIVWPSGVTQVLYDVAINIRMTVTEPIPAAGDLSADLVVDNDDISLFVTALVDGNAYHALYPGVPLATGDVNGDGSFDNEDIGPFVQLLIGAPATVPEPATVWLLLVGAVPLGSPAIRRWRLSKSRL
jgi:FG-GAP-like repeat/ASPIC and UnbV